MVFVIEKHRVPQRHLAFVFDCLSPLCRPTLLLEKYQPWLDLKIPSKVDASLSEVIYTRQHDNNDSIIDFTMFSIFLKILELVLENFVYPWYR